MQPSRLIHFILPSSCLTALEKHWTVICNLEKSYAYASDLMQVIYV
jgi:hypothetical protein